MPGWHERTLKLQETGKLQLAGIVEEQHPDRTRLFMRWKRMDWPVLVDSLDLLGVSAVPIAVLIDERSVVRAVNPREEDLERFLSLPPPAEEGAPPQGKPAAGDGVQAPARHFRFPEPPPPPSGGGLEAARVSMQRGDALFLAAQSELMTHETAPKTALDRLDAAQASYRRAIELGGPPEARFRLGVVLRTRYDAGFGKPGDFQAAVAAWGEALDLRPNQYIWRRRIQQYGPRLEKPYPFYDWVGEARRGIAARGEKPPPLRVEPKGAEIAHPGRTFEKQSAAEREPDPSGRIRRDAAEPLVTVETACVPARVDRGRTARIHVVLRPSRARRAHWNNEAGGTKVWIGEARGVEIAQRLLEAPPAREETSDEPRELETEVRIAADAPRGRIALPAYTLYYVCEDENGVCRYLRRDFTILLEVR